MRLGYFQRGLSQAQDQCWTFPCYPWRTCFKRPSVFLVLLGVLVLSVYSTPALEAQAVYGRIFGDVSDPSGRMVPDAEITAISLERGTETRTKTNERGGFDLGHLLPGTYRLRAAYPGFKITEIVNIPVHVDEASRVDMRLEIGAVSERVEVSAEKDVPLLKTDRADVSVTFDQRVIFLGTGI